MSWITSRKLGYRADFEQEVCTVSVREKMVCHKGVVFWCRTVSEVKLQLNDYLSDDLVLIVVGIAIEFYKYCSIYVLQNVFVWRLLVCLHNETHKGNSQNEFYTLPPPQG